MEIKDQIAYYDQLWSERKFLNSLKLRRAIKILEYFVEVKRKIKEPLTLDLGCGDGRFTAFMGEFAKTDAIELSVEAVKNANQLYPHVHYFQGDVLEHTFKKNHYDVVVSQEVIEHIEDQAKYIEVCHAVLKKGGYLILTTPNNKVFNHMKGGNWSTQPIENVLSPSELKTLVGKSFRIIRHESIIFNFGNQGYFKWVNHPYFIAGFEKLGLAALRERWLSKRGYGLHQCIFAQK
jgi:2-polyprenyl-3-methyl-5-hydroxy-6-metoxy-1,4-benzoquinol methylase